MDVQAATATLPTVTFNFPPLPTLAPAPPADAAPAPSDATSVPTVSGTGSGSSSGTSSTSTATTGLGTAPDPTPGLALLPPTGSGKTASDTGSLPANVGKIYNIAGSNIAVSFQVASGSNEIVTVFTDKTSGKVIVQFPSETLIALAKFFQKLDGGGSDSNGAVVDKKV